MNRNLDYDPPTADPTKNIANVISIDICKGYLPKLMSGSRGCNGYTFVSTVCGWFLMSLTAMTSDEVDYSP